MQSELGFRVAGKVLERLVDAGQAVKRGQPLMRIDPLDLKLAAQAQQEAVAAARARALQTAEEEARYRDLRGKGAISASAYDQVKAAADAAKAQLSAAEAQANVARNASGYAELLADSDAVVMETLAEAGQVVGAGQTVVRLAHAGRREALIQLPETQIPNGSAPARDALQVPLAAIFDAGQGAGVWLISGKPATVFRRAVTIEQLADDSAQVIGQLRPGDRIVAMGAHLLSEGAQVRAAAMEGAQP